MICPGCQQLLPDDSLFCSRCGVATAKINLNTTIKNSPDTDPNNKIRDHGSHDPRIGLVLDSKYQLIERLGQGGMGAVYRAKRLHIGDEVAVKLLSHDLLRDEYAIERFRREARSAAMIRHPNVVSIHDFNDAGDNGDSKEAYIVMELVSGESLRQLLEHESRLPPERAVALMLNICAGVGVAHRQGLLHRDLKPDNVIVTPATLDSERETAKVVDFGLAKIREENVSPLTETGSLMGTIYYMSPEQCRGEKLDPRADVYSLGAMLYEMLSAHPPFRSSNITGLITKHLNEPPPPFEPSLLIPPALAAVCFKALAKSRELRQVDAIAFGKELQTALSDPTVYRNVGLSANSLPPTITSERRTSHLWKWIVAIVGVSIFAIVLVGLGVAAKFGPDLLWQKKSPPEQNNRAQTTPKPQESPANVAAANVSVGDLSGKWTGTYGPLNQTTTLTINNHNGDSFEGILEQGGTRVAFKGTIESGTIHMKQSAVLSGADWSLGEDSGTVSSDGKRMSGTGQDAMGGALGITYQWTFSRIENSKL
jgi:serine/threonine protein kinase